MRAESTFLTRMAEVQRDSRYGCFCRWFKTAQFIPPNSRSFKTQDVVMFRSMNIQQMIMRSLLSLLGLLGLTLLASPVSAQLFGPGPSDPALFDDVTAVTDDPIDPVSYTHLTLPTILLV